MLGNATVVIVRPTAGGFDRYNNVVAGTPLRITVCGVGIAPRSSTDLRQDGRNGAIRGLTAYLPADTDVRATDALEVDGLLYEIDGVPGDWVSPLTGWRPGIEVPLRRADG